MTDSGTKCAWVIHESKAVQIHVHSNRRCLYVPQVPGSVKNPHNNNNQDSDFRTSSPEVIKPFFMLNSAEYVDVVLIINLKLLTIANCFLLNIAEHENFPANNY